MHTHKHTHRVMMVDALKIIFNQRFISFLFFLPLALVEKQNKKIKARARDIVLALEEKVKKRGKAQ